MKLSEAIIELEKAIKEYGDIELIDGSSGILMTSYVNRLYIYDNEVKITKEAAISI